MRFDEDALGDYRIYAGALEGPQGDGYIAAMIVHRVRGVVKPREAYRDDRMAGGHRWESAEAALAYALGKARQVIEERPRMLAC